MVTSIQYSILLFGLSEDLLICIALLPRDLNDFGEATNKELLESSNVFVVAVPRLTAVH